MSIVTRCPECGTTFRVTPLQLQAQHGMVRCGRCAHVFDGFKTLATLQDTAPPATPEIAPEASPAPSAVAIIDTELPPQAQPAPAVSTPSEDPASEESLEIRHASIVEPDLLLIAPTEFVVPARRGGGVWAFGSLLLVIGLAAQGAYFYRSDIAANLPEARPQLAKMCELLHCTVALPQQPREISIEASDMQATDPANPGLIALTATLRNHATTELGYPAIDVVLTNTKEHTVARRIFVPAEYLIGSKDARGIAPNAEVTVRLDMDTGDLGAAGFRLDLVAAPPR